MHTDCIRPTGTPPYDAIAERVLGGGSVDRPEAAAILAGPDGELAAVLHAAFRVREHFHGRRVKLCQLRNARSGLCPEDCHYCSQSAISDAAIPRYRLDSVPELLAGARRAVAAGARRYCMVTSGRGPSENDIARFTTAARTIKGEFPQLELCVSLGLLGEEEARQLKASGVGWVNHNLNTSERFHPDICTTHSYEDRVNTVRSVQRAGLHTCCGGIIGMGETDEDIIDLAFALRELRVDSLPLNFLIPIQGTPFSGKRELTPTRCLRALCLMRFTNPESEIRMAGGREGNLGWFQALQASSDAHQMIADMGFEIEAME